MSQMDYITLSSTILIRRTDGRIQPAFVAEKSDDENFVLVHFRETNSMGDGEMDEVLCKKVMLMDIMELNPEIFQEKHKFNDSGGGDA